MDVITTTLPAETNIETLAAPTILPDESVKPKFSAKDVMDKVEEIAAKRDDAWPTIAALTVLYVLRGARREAVTKHLEAKGFKWARAATQAGERFSNGVLSADDRVRVYGLPLVTAMNDVLTLMRNHRDAHGATNWTNEWYAIAGTLNPEDSRKILDGKKADKAAKAADKLKAKEAAEKAELPDLNPVQVDPVAFLLAQFEAMSPDCQEEVMSRLQEYYLGKAMVINAEAQSMPMTGTLN